MQTSELAVRRQPLTRGSICEAALRMIDTRGLAAVGMRGLASELGVKAGSLYHHFRNKEDLLGGVAELLYRRLGPLPCETEWRDQVCAIFSQLAEAVQMHPQAAPILIRHIAHSTGGHERAEALAIAVSGSGLDPNGCASLLNNLAALLAGHSFFNLQATVSSGSTGAPNLPIGDYLLGGGTQEKLLLSEFTLGTQALIRGFSPAPADQGLQHLE